MNHSVLTPILPPTSKYNPPPLAISKDETNNMNYELAWAGSSRSSQLNGPADPGWERPVLAVLLKMDWEGGPNCNVGVVF